MIISDLNYIQSADATEVNGGFADTNILTSKIVNLTQTAIQGSSAVSGFGGASAFGSAGNSAFVSQ